ncbi:MAG: flagellar hook assembly protein FlgD [Polynucleobacter sp.]
MATSPMSGIRTYDPAAANRPRDTDPNTGMSAADQTQNFLKLLIAQIKNQDPMSPMDASTMTAQMSQLNMVSSMGTMNTSMQAMLAQMQSANFLNQATLIGHSPMVAGNTINFMGGEVILGANLANPLQGVVATIKDASGNVVGTADLGNLNSGMTNFAFDGIDASGATMPNGIYRVEITGKNSAGANEIPTAYVGSPVVSILKDGSSGQALLKLADGRSIKASEVTQWVN